MEIRKNRGALKWILIIICFVFLTVFLLLPLVSSVLGAALFLIFGALIREDTPPVVWVMVGLGNMVIAAAPCLLLTLLLRLPLEAWKDCLPPMLLSLYPFSAALWSKAVGSRESH